MNNIFQDELISAIEKLLSERYPDYIFKKIYEDQDINFLGERYIRIDFWDLVNQRSLGVGLGISKTEQFNTNVPLIETLIYRIDRELTKFKENCDVDYSAYRFLYIFVSRCDVYGRPSFAYG